MTYSNTSGPTPAQYSTGQFDQFLTTIAIRDMQADTTFMAPSVFPIVPVALQGQKYKVWHRGSLLRPEMRRKPYGDRPVQGTYKTGEDSYFADVWALEKVIDPSDIANAMDPQEPFEGATAYLAGQARLSIDVEWAGKYFVADRWGFNYRGVASNPSSTSDTPEFLQFDQPGANPAQFIRTRIARMLLLTGRGPNVLIIGENVYQYLVEDETFIDRIKYTQQGIIDIDLMASFFGVKKVVQARTVVNAAEEGKEDDFEFINDPNAMLLVYAAPRPSKDEPSAGYIFNWTGLFSAYKGPREQATGAGGLAIVRRGYDDRAPADWVQVHSAIDIKITAPDLGMYFQNVIGRNYLTE